MRYGLLGPVEVLDGDAPVDIGGRQPRTVLAMLLAAEGRTVTTESLVDALWGEERPRSCMSTLQATVSRLRRALGTSGPALTFAEAGYRLDVAAADVDARRFERSADLGHQQLEAGETSTALATLDDALALWRGPALCDVVIGPQLAALATRLEEQRLAALEDRADAALRLGRHGIVVGELHELAEAHPLREGFRAKLALALYRSGRQAEALAVIAATRALLRDELGVDPSRGLSVLERAILAQDPALDPPDRPPVQPPTASQPASGAPPESVEPVVSVGPPRAVSSRSAVPAVRYARVGRTRIAHQVLGEGPIDLVWLPGWVSNLEVGWEEPRYRSFMLSLAEHSRLVLLDKRGTGLSDPVAIDAVPDLATRAGDVAAVLDELGSERAVVLGFSEGGTMGVHLAATQPDRVAGLVLYGAFARATPADGHPYGWTREQNRRRLVLPLERGETADPRWIAPSMADDAVYRDWFARYHRLAAPPGVALALLAANAGIDVRDDLPAVQAPTLVLHRAHDPLVEVGQARVLAEGIPGARLEVLPGEDHWPWVGDADAVLAAVHEFLDTLGEGGSSSSSTAAGTGTA